ncbi:MAG: EamA family transporter [Gracilimonas sp.]|uniref:EamA family transporter n=1 Tax=Gracilimonas sp. TaxID=1974203 RepID=UPI00198B4EE5|nr:EamA family transporter [Gracilimonas sp.]MBD3615729.1 EamA family transporter [Gracilimonas sp.]
MNILKILVCNYLAGFLISLLNSHELSVFPDAAITLSNWLIGLVLLLGVIFIANMVVYSRSIDRVGMGVSIAAMRMSLVFPIAASLFVFGETIGGIKYIGIILALGSLLLMVPRIRTKSISGLSDAWLPILIFIMTGFADTGLKVYERVFSKQMSEDLFISGIFFVSFLVGMGILIKRNEIHFTFKEIGYGIVTGIVNLYSSIFLIYALKLMPGSIVFPLVNVTLVVSGTFIGILIWKDKPSLKQWSGLGIAIISIFLLLG